MHVASRKTRGLSPGISKSKQPDLLQDPHRAGSLREIYYGDLQAPAPKNRLGCCRFTIWGSFRPCQRDVGRVELHKTAFLRHKPSCVSQMQRKSSSPLGRTNQLLKHQNCRPPSTNVDALSDERQRGDWTVAKAFTLR